MRRPWRAQLAAHLESVFAGQHDIQQDEIEAASCARWDAASPSDHDLHLVALHLEVVFQAEGDARLVFHYQDAGHARSHYPAAAS